MRHIARSFSCDADGCRRTCSVDPDVSWEALAVRAAVAGWQRIEDGKYGQDDQHLCPTHRRPE